ncbi:sensor histidine kinase [Chitinophaga sp. 22321]|uniref:Histidine kinase n=1 Tax=Chitinophaga hostae TaxID=2831022 RepID=A0ABS5JAS7_9BACT|nr:histidine kinase [Chitinophaga hostae]MBS0032317.1 histidine kinase [Chitinophaga hostae]
MSNDLPLKSLKTLNWMITLATALLAFIFLLAVIQDAYQSLLRALQVIIFMTAQSFLNIFLLDVFTGRKQAEKKYARLKFYIASYIACIINWVFVKTLYTAITDTKWEGEGPHIFQAYSLAILAISVLNTLIIVLQDLVILQHNKAKGEIENLQLKANVSETANLLLRQQIHPHFLFNALNTIKSLYKRDLQQGEDYLVHLANFLRASISHHNTEITLIKDELEFCLDYLKMQQIRFGAALNYSIAISEDTIQHQYLPFFSLQPLIENVLKHNDLTEERPILIRIKEENGYVSVTNNLQLRNYKETSTGQGLSNLAERYRLLNEEAITIKSDSHFFTVRIKILQR